MDKFHSCMLTFTVYMYTFLFSLIWFEILLLTCPPSWNQGCTVIKPVTIKTSLQINPHDPHSCLHLAKRTNPCCCFCLAFDFCRFCVIIRFFHPHHNDQWPTTSKDFLSQILSITIFSYFNSWERASFSPFQCWVLNKVTTGTIDNVFGMTQ